MDIEKVFRPNKWFVLFCGLLVVVWFILQTVAKMRIADEAKILATHMYTWTWPGLRCRSQAQISGADVVQKTDTTAIVEVRGRQVMSVTEPGSTDQREVVDCKARLWFYKLSNYWVLGRVELQ